MTITIDGVAQVDVPISADGVRLAIESIASDRLVKTILINEQEALIDDVLTGNTSVTSNDEIVIVTSTLDELIIDTIESARSLNPSLLRTLESVATHIRTGATSDAGIEFADAVPGLQWTADVLDKLAGLHPGPSDVHRMDEQCKEVMPQLLDAWASLDYVYIADLVEYELVPWLQSWTQLAEMFAAQMKLEKLKPQ